MSTCRSLVYSNHFGCFESTFDEEDAAGRRADEASRLLGAHEKCNFDKYGFETGYDGSAVGQANLMPGGSSESAKNTGRKSGICGVQPSGGHAAHPYRAKVSVPDCRFIKPPRLSLTPWEAVRREKCKCKLVSPPDSS